MKMRAAFAATFVFGLLASVGFSQGEMSSAGKKADGLSTRVADALAARVSYQPAAPADTAVAPAKPRNEIPRVSDRVQERPAVFAGPAVAAERASLAGPRDYVSLPSAADREKARVEEMEARGAGRATTGQSLVANAWALAPWLVNGKGVPWPFIGSGLLWGK